MPLLTMLLQALTVGSFLFAFASCQGCSRANLPAIANGFVYLGQSYEGASRRVGCNAGYQAFGSSDLNFITCRNGMWTMPLIQCFQRKIKQF